MNDKSLKKFIYLMGLITALSFAKPVEANELSSEIQGKIKIEHRIYNRPLDYKDIGLSIEQEKKSNNPWKLGGSKYDLPEKIDLKLKKYPLLERVATRIYEESLRAKDGVEKNLKEKDMYIQNKGIVWEKNPKDIENTKIGVTPKKLYLNYADERDSYIKKNVNLSVNKKGETKLEAGVNIKFH